MTKINGGGGNLISRLIRKPIDNLMNPKTPPKAAQSVVDQRTSGGYEVKTEDKRGLFTGRETTVSATRENADGKSTRSSNFVNGRLQTSTSSSEQTSGNLTTSTSIDRGYARDGSVARERVTSGAVTRYGDHTTIGRSLVTDGRFSGETIKFDNTNGNTSRSTTVSNSSGPRVTDSAVDNQLEYHGGEYLTGIRHGNRRWVKGRFEATHGMTYDNYRRSDRQTTITRDTRGPETRGTEADTARLDSAKTRSNRFGTAQKGLDILGSAGLRTTLAQSERTDRHVGADWQSSISADGKGTTETLVGPRAATSTFGEVTLGADGLKARGDAEASAGLYAQIRGTRDTGMGTLSGGVGVKAEVSAQATGQASLNANGLNAKGSVSVGAEISAEANGSFRLPAITIGGQEVDAGISATGRVAAQAEAHADAKVQFTGNPPRAVVEGRAGASAVVKAEGDVKIDAGPFSVTAEGYVSAGAEAQVNGSIGYDDGKLSLSFGAGAALGLGAGGRVQLEVDIKQVGQLAAGVAAEAYEGSFIDDQVDKFDLTGDNEFNMQDVRVIGNAAAEVATEAVEVVGNAVSSGVEAVGNAAEAVGDAVSGAADAVGGALSDGAEAVGEFFSGW